ncbi:MAG: (S)-ureidoglycine aminohydrolase [Candidatus Eisenbacteria bacterium]
MSQDGLVESRAVVHRRYAILPPEGIPESVLPGWEATRARVLAAPAMGAAFVEILLELDAGGGGDHQLAERVEAFFYVLDGEATLARGGRTHTLAAGGYAYLVPGSAFALRATRGARLLWLKKTYMPLPGHAPGEVVGKESTVKGEPFMGDPELLLKKLLPDTLAYDMAMNIFTFQTGSSLPVTETHVMEHGLYLFEGQGVYYLGHEWHEVHSGDFIWMGPYCPQSFHATGATPARYIYYKDVNRDVEPRP